MFFPSLCRMNYLQSIAIPIWVIGLVGLAFLYLIVRGMPRIEGYVVFGGKKEPFQDKKAPGEECMASDECMSAQCDMEEGASSGKCM